MPHDKKGRKISVGDHVKYTSELSKEVEIGRVSAIYEGTDTCNLQVQSADDARVLTAKDCELIMLKDGSEPASASPTYRTTDAVQKAAERGFEEALDSGLSKKTALSLLLFVLLSTSVFADAPAARPSPKPAPTAVPSPSPLPVVEPMEVLEPVGDRQCFDETDCACIGPKGWVVCVPSQPAVRAAIMPLPAEKPRPSWWPVLDLTKWTVQLDGGLQSVILNDGEKREYATGAVEFAGPLSGFDLWQRTEVLGEQDGGRLDFSRPQSFRAVLVDAKVSRAVHGSFAFGVRGGTTFSVEGGQFAPYDPRLWTLQGDVSVKLKRFILSAYGGHDGAIGGYGLGGSIGIPVAGGRPQLLTSFDYPLAKPAGRENGPLPWQLKAGARIIIAKEFLSDLF